MFVELQIFKINLFVTTMQISSPTSPLKLKIMNVVFCLKQFKLVLDLKLNIVLPTCLNF